MKTELVETCCDGYELNEDRDGCIPHCSQRCLHGTCLHPDVCQCEPGYGGHNCNKSKHIRIWRWYCKMLSIFQRNSKKRRVPRSILRISRTHVSSFLVFLCHCLVNFNAHAVWPTILLPQIKLRFLPCNRHSRKLRFVVSNEELILAHVGKSVDVLIFVPSGSVFVPF